MIGLFVVAAAAAQSPASESTKPALKTCPDGSVIYASQDCIVFPDHRYLMDHQPQVAIKTVEWWCGRDRQPSRVRIAIRQRADAGTGTWAKSRDLTILTLITPGRPASPAVRRRLRDELGSLVEVGDMYGRCLNQRGGEPRAIFHFRGYERGARDPRRIEIDMY